MLGDRRRLEVYFAGSVILNLKRKKKSENENQTTLTEKVLGFYALGLSFFIL